MPQPIEGNKRRMRHSVRHFLGIVEWDLMIVASMYQ